MLVNIYLRFYYLLPSIIDRTIEPIFMNDQAVNCLIHIRGEKVVHILGSFPFGLYASRARANDLFC